MRTFEACVLVSLECLERSQASAVAMLDFTEEGLTLSTCSSSMATTHPPLICLPGSLHRDHSAQMQYCEEHNDCDVSDLLFDTQREPATLRA